MEPTNGLAVATPPTPARAPVALVGGVVKITDVDQLGRMVKMICQSGWLPHGVSTEAQVGIILLAGLEVGLGITQSLQNIMVVNNRPTVWGDAALGLVQASGELADIEEVCDGKGDDYGCTCRVVRKNRQTPTVRRFTVADAKNAGLWGKAGPWKNYPARMLQMRARSFAIRDAFPDVLKGLSIREEVEDITAEPMTRRVESTSTAYSPVPSKAASKLDALADEPQGGAAPGSQAPGSAAPPAAFDPAEIAAEMEKGQGKKPAFDMDGNPV